MCLLFECMPLQELEEEYDKARSVLKDALRAANWTATVDSTYTEYLEALTGSDDAADSAAADKEGEVGEGAGAAAGGAGDTAMADVDANEGKGSKGDKGDGLDASLAAKVAAVRDSHKRVYFEEQVRSNRGCGWRQRAWVSWDRCLQVAVVSQADLGKDKGSCWAIPAGHACLDVHQPHSVGSGKVASCLLHAVLCTRSCQHAP
jgi:hypothetical protein